MTSLAGGPPLSSNSSSCDRGGANGQMVVNVGRDKSHSASGPLTETDVGLPAASVVNRGSATITITTTTVPPSPPPSSPSMTSEAPTTEGGGEPIGKSASTTTFTSMFSGNGVPFSARGLAAGEARRPTTVGSCFLQPEMMNDGAAKKMDDHYDQHNRPLSSAEQLLSAKNNQRRHTVWYYNAYNSNPTQYGRRHGDDFIVTPFAQLLASLRNVRTNLSAIASLPSASGNVSGIGDHSISKQPSPAPPSVHPSTTQRRAASASGAVGIASSGSGGSAAAAAALTAAALLSGGGSGSVSGDTSASMALPDAVQQCAQETLEELDWCLDQLEAIQIHRSVTEMASSKFRKLLNKELSQFAESSKSGTQISKFLINTYMEDRNEDEEEAAAAAAAAAAAVGLKMSDSIDNNLSRQQQKRLQQIVAGAAEDTPSSSGNFMASCPASAAVSSSIGANSPQMSLFNKAKIAAMSRISGVRKLRVGSHFPGGVPPEYGVQCQKEIQVYMQRINEWGINVFKIHELSKQHSLTAVTYTLLRERGLLQRFDIRADVLVTYLLHLEHHYKDNPYHNQVHGADVAQSIHVLISSPALEGVFSDLEILAAVIAAAIHDVDHPGYTNQYLINSNSELAIMYNDESVLEQHHLAVAFKLLQDSHCDFLAAFSKKQRQTFRKIVIEMVLATDMSKHMTLLADLKTMVEAKKVSGSSVVTLDKYNDRIQVLQSMIHLADLSNPTKPIELYRNWNERILEEYWRQGDKEKELGLEVSPMCDRGNVTIEKSQIGFIDYIVHPLFETWAELVYPDVQHILDQLEDNRQWYLARLDPEEQHVLGESETTAAAAAASTTNSGAATPMRRRNKAGGGGNTTASAAGSSVTPQPGSASGSADASTIAAVAAALVSAPSVTTSGGSHQSSRSDSNASAKQLSQQNTGNVQPMKPMRTSTVSESGALPSSSNESCRRRSGDSTTVAPTATALSSGGDGGVEKRKS